MHFASFSDFLAMGGYAFYVWLSDPALPGRHRHFHPYENPRPAR